MRKITLAVLFVSLGVSLAFAQNAADKALAAVKPLDRPLKNEAAADAARVKSEDRVPKRAAKAAQTGEDYHKFEISGGYSAMRVGGIVGEGEAFSAGEDQEMSGLFSPFPSNPDLTANPANLFPTTPFRSVGGRNNGRVMHGFNASAVYNFTKRLGVKVEVSGHYGSDQANLPRLILVAPIEFVSCAAVGFPSVPGNNCGRILPIQSSYPPRTVRGTLISNGGTFSAKQRHYNFLGGLQLKNNSTEKRFKPFAHALAGISRQSVKLSDFDDQRRLAIYDGKDEFTNTGFTMSLGGGIDIRLSKRIDLRVFQLDYNPVRIKSQQILDFQQPIITGIGNNLTFSNLETAPLYSASEVRINSRWQNNYRLSVGIVFH